MSLEEASYIRSLTSPHNYLQASRESGVLELLPFFPASASPLTLISTHMSLVFMHDQYVFKLKRSVTFPFCDFSSVLLREQYCKRECELNGRLAKDVYLGICPVFQSVSGEFMVVLLPCLNDIVDIKTSEGSVVDWVVMMKRLKDEEQMEFLLLHNLLSDNHSNRVVDLIVDFHSAAARSPSINEFASFERVSKNVWFVCYSTYIYIFT
jgi:aminoglycoside phosphotransferase family enzyme